MAAGVQKNDEVGRMIAAGGAAGTDGLRVRRSLVKIVHIEVEVETVAAPHCPARSGACD